MLKGVLRLVSTALCCAAIYFFFTGWVNVSGQEMISSIGSIFDIEIPSSFTVDNLRKMAESLNDLGDDLRLKALYYYAWSLYLIPALSIICILMMLMKKAGFGVFSSVINFLLVAVFIAGVFYAENYIQQELNKSVFGSFVGFGGILHLTNTPWYLLGLMATNTVVSRLAK